MNDLQFLSGYNNKRIVIAPLNWGLGHATRCVPLINTLSTDNEVILASDGIALSWLRQEFPQLETILLPSYDIDYSSRHMWYNVLKSSPKLGVAIRSEHAVIERLIDDRSIDIIISDHRLGLYTDKCESYVIAHQISIPHTNRVLKGMITAINKGYLNRYSQVWITDYEDGGSRLAGDVSSAQGLRDYQYIGPLSRLMNVDVEEDIDLLVMLSGPEPLRTEFERQCVSALYTCSQLQHVTIIRGTLDHRLDMDYPDHWEVINLADTKILEHSINRAKQVLCRSGYSSIMDLEHLGKKAILVPTPRQPEQEYLATHLQDRSNYRCITVDKLTETLSRL